MNARHRLRALALLGAVAVGLSGCGDDRSPLEVRLRGSVTDPGGLAGVVLEVEGQRLTAEDFEPDESGLLEASLRVPESGTLVVAAELSQDGEVAGAGTVSWGLRPDTRWTLEVRRQAGDPAEMCFGCEGSGRIELAEWARNEPGEALWLTWAGTREGSGVVY